MPYLDLQELADELEELRTTVDFHNDGDHAVEEEGGEGPNDECPLCFPESEEAERLKALEELEGQFFTSLSEYVKNETTAIPEFEFAEYAEQLADELGYLDDNTTSRWPFNHIDWEDAADDLKQDYIEFEWENTTYLVRSF